MRRDGGAGQSGIGAVCLCLVLSLSAGPGHALDLLDPSNGGVLTLVDSEYNSSSYAGDNLTDDDSESLWLSSEPVNDLLYQLNGSAGSACFGGLTLENYGNSRSIRTFSILSTEESGRSTDTGTDGWIPVAADPSPTGPINHLHWSQGGRLLSVSTEYNSTTYAGRHVNDGSVRSLWLSGENTNTLEYAFDTDWNGATGDAVNVDEIRLHNYGNSRSVSRFQVHVDRDGIGWSRLAVPGTEAGDPDFNFLLEPEGARLVRIDSEYNSTSYAGGRLHDGDLNSQWLSSKANNELDFEFDIDLDGTTSVDGDSDDVFDLETIRLWNYGNTRSVRLFQVEVRTASSPGWTPLEVPGSGAGEPDFNFLLDWEGAILTRVDAQYNTTSYAGAHLHDGDLNSRWLSSRSNNEFDFEFDVDGDGTTGLAGDSHDRFRIEEIRLYNYGNSRSVKLFQVEVKTQNRPSWTPVEVPGSGAGDAGFNFALAHEGASLSRIDAQYNTTSYAASNLHDGDLGSRWLSSKPDNELELVFDTDGDGSTGDAVNFYTVRLHNYGNSRSIQTFEIEVQTGGASWSAVTAPGGGTVFTAAQASAAQDFSVGPLSGVTAVRLRTLTNHGDSYTGAGEIELLGDSVRASHTFTAAQSSVGQSFVLDPLDRVDDVTAVRFRSIQNYGDSYSGARELEILGQSLGASHTFEAAQGAGGQDFVLDASDRPTDVTAVRFRSVRNYGDSYTGMNELELLGPATRERYTFEPGQGVGPHVFTLDLEDRVEDVIGARFQTLNNFGDSYIGARQLELLGDPVGPSFVFSAAQTSALQSFSFDPTPGTIFRLRALENYGDSYVGAREIELEAESGCGGGSGRIVISHDGSGVHCTPEIVGISVVDGTGAPVVSYEETIVLDTQTGTGDWALQAGSGGVFLDATPGDGLATYTFSASDRGTASFSVTHVTNATAVDLDAYQSDDAGMRDDDSEGMLMLSPSSFLLTASALPDPAPTPIDDPIGAQTAGSGFAVHLTAYGTTSSNPSCGVIESYSGDKALRFWVVHDDPSTGIRVPTIEGGAIAASAAAATSRSVTFDQGRAVVAAGYKDVGRIAIHALDDSGALPIGGSTGGFVSRPADLVVVAVENAAGEPNPGLSTPTGDPFARAGEPFTVRVEAHDAVGDLTPSYGREAQPEGIRIRSSTLVAPAGGRNGTQDDGAIENDDAFAAIAPDGRFTGSSFAFDEVGAIRLVAGVADGDYLGSGDVNGTESPVVGRFAPSELEVTANTPRFETGCGIGAFTWIGQPFGFASGEEARLQIRAMNASGGTTANYAGSWWRLTHASLAGRSYQAGSGTLDQSGLPPTSSDPAIVSNGDGTGSLSFSTGSGLLIARDGLVAPFDAEIQLRIDVLDEDGTAHAGNPFTLGATGPGQGIGFDVSKRFQLGRLRFENAHGSELVDLPMVLRAQHFDGTSFVDDDNDSCSDIPASALALTPQPASLAATPSISHRPLFSGDSGLVLSAPNVDGTLDIVVDLGPTGADLPWLRYDWPEDGNLDGLLDDDPSAQATFGIWKGRDSVIYMREVY